MSMSSPPGRLLRPGVLAANTGAGSGSPTSSSPGLGRPLINKMALAQTNTPMLVQSLRRNPRYRWDGSIRRYSVKNRPNV